MIEWKKKSKVHKITALLPCECVQLFFIPLQSSSDANDSSILTRTSTQNAYNGQSERFFFLNKNYVFLVVGLAPVLKLEDVNIKENNEHTMIEKIKELQIFFV